ASSRAGTVFNHPCLASMIARRRGLFPARLPRRAAASSSFSFAEILGGLLFRHLSSRWVRMARCSCPGARLHRLLVTCGGFRIFLFCCSLLLLQSHCQSFAPSQFFRGKHRPTAILRTAIAWGFFFVAVIKTVVIAKLFAGYNVADGHDPDTLVNFLSLAIRIAGVVDKHSDAVAIDYFGAVANTE